jgi:GT2 family glycosyltransferase
MKVAIVILNYNGQPYLQQFLPTVVQYSPSENGYSTEIIVADNASTDSSVAYLQAHFPSVRCLCLTQNFGFAEGYNQALRQVSADIYVLLNSDVEVTEGWLVPIIALLQTDAQVAAVQPKIRAFHQKTHFEHAGASGGFVDALGYPFCRGRVFGEVESDAGQYDDAVEIFWATGAALFIRAELYHQAGGFDGDYFAHMEEIDLCWRLRRAGFRVMVQPDSVVYHVGGGTLKTENPFKTYLNFRNNLVTILKNEQQGRVAVVFVARLFLDGLAGVQFLLQGKIPQIFAIIKAHFAVYGMARRIAQKRKQTAEIVEKIRIAPARSNPFARKSILFDFFIKQKKQFRDF